LDIIWPIRHLAWPKVIAAILIAITCLPGNAATYSVSFDGLVSSKIEPVIRPAFGKIITFTDTAAVRLHLVNRRESKIAARVRIYGTNNAEISSNYSDKIILLKAGGRQQLTLLFTTGPGDQQALRICSEFRMEQGDWIEAGCDIYQVITIPPLAGN